MNHLVSVIIPVFNREKFIEECLHSVYQQAYRPIELVIVDDGSTDNSISIVEKFIEQHDSNDFSIFFLKQQTHNGNIARNQGLLKSKGKYIQFLDSDDVLLPDKISSQVYLLDNFDYDLVYCKVELCDLHLKSLNQFFGIPFNNTALEISKYTWQTMCPLYDRSVFEKLGYWNEKLTVAQDWEFCVRTKLLNPKLYFQNATGGLLRVHHVGRLKNKEKRIQDLKSYFIAYNSVLEQAKKYNYIDKVFLKRMTLRFILLAKQFIALKQFEKATKSLENAGRIAPKLWKPFLFVASKALKLA